MRYFQKVNGPFMRKTDEPGQPFDMNRWAVPEFEYLQSNQWLFHEKIDGTSIVVKYTPDSDEGPARVEFGGHTARSVLPVPLLNRLVELFPTSRFSNFESGVTLYGEGVGPKIQGSGKYLDGEYGFILFDVRVGDWWLTQETVEEIAGDLEIPNAPFMGLGSLWSGIVMVEQELTSEFGNFEAEGIVARPRLELTDRAGRRIITKLKARDFRA